MAWLVLVDDITQALIGQLYGLFLPYCPRADHKAESHIINNLLNSNVLFLRENLKPRPCRIDLAFAWSIRQGLGRDFPIKTSLSVNKQLVLYCNVLHCIVMYRTSYDLEVNMFCLHLCHLNSITSGQFLSVMTYRKCSTLRKSHRPFWVIEWCLELTQIS